MSESPINETIAAAFHRAAEEEARAVARRAAADARRAARNRPTSARRITAARRAQDAEMADLYRTGAGVAAIAKVTGLSRRRLERRLGPAVLRHG